MSICQRQDTELWNNHSPDSKILGVPVSRCMRALVYNMASRGKVNMYGLLTKCEVKMAGYWLSSFLREFNLANKERGQYPAILSEQAWSIKD